jgi:phospholipid/cholesterol/gamma-HCH transport system substrate-binding protein
MAQRKSLAWTELRVGLLVVASFVLLALAIFYIGGESAFLAPKYKITAFFSNANGLRKGAEVWLEGVTIGNVSSVSISGLPERTKSVQVELSLDKRYQNFVRSDSLLSINTIGLLGDKDVEISRGTAAGQVVPDGGVLQGQEEADIKRIITGTNDFIANLDVLGDQVKKITDRVERGEGTLGRLLTDTTIYDNVNLTLTEAHGLIADARTGEGTIGRLMSDDALYRKVNDTMDRTNLLLDKIQSGHGTLARLINDPSLYNRTDRLLEQTQTIVDSMNRGEGSLGKFIKDDAFYTEARQTMQRVQNLVTSVESGQGTAGRLVQDPTLYNSLNQTSSEILKLLYDFRQNPKKFLTVSFKLF